MQTESDLTISGDMTIHNFIYENAPMGNVGAEVVYMPKDTSRRKAACPTCL